MPALAGKALRARRTKLELSVRQVEELTSALGHAVNRSTLSKVERGAANLSIVDLAALAHVLDLDPVEVVDSVMSHLRPAAKEGRSATDAIADGVRVARGGDMLFAAAIWDSAARIDRISLDDLCRARLYAARAYVRVGRYRIAAARADAAVESAESVTLLMRSVALLAFVAAKMGMRRRCGSLVRDLRDFDGLGRSDNAYRLSWLAAIAAELGQHDLAAEHAQSAAQLLGRGNEWVRAEALALRESALAGHAVDEARMVRLEHQLDGLSHTDEAAIAARISLGTAFFRRGYYASALPLLIAGARGSSVLKSHEDAMGAYAMAADAARSLGNHALERKLSKLVKEEQASCRSVHGFLSPGEIDQ